MSVSDLSGVERAAVAGWYGKLPALGDFASRRLPASFVALWDEWLQRSIAASRDQLGERWLGIYLKSPMWRFALMPRVCGPTFWTGVMMPSVDRVGRYFPLTLALPLAPAFDVLGLVTGAHAWFDAIEQIALATLRADFDADALELALAGEPFPFGAAVEVPLPERAAATELARWWRGAGDAPLHLDLSSTHVLASLIRLAGPELLAALGDGRSLWWTRDGPEGATALSAFIGLPVPQAFAGMLGVG